MFSKTGMIIFDTIVIDPFTKVYGYVKDTINVLSTGNILINTVTMVSLFKIIFNFWWVVL